MKLQERDIFLRNVRWLTPDYKALYLSIYIELFHKQISRWLRFYDEETVEMRFRNHLICENATLKGKFHGCESFR
jgi:hypothetical protein